MPALAVKSRQTVADKPARARNKLVPTKRVAEAIRLMIDEGLERKQAAQAVGLSDHSLYCAMKQPHVLAAYNDRMEVLRTGLRPRALRKMGDLLNAQSEGVQFKAAEYLDGQNRGQHTIGAVQVNVQNNTSVSVQPGYVIRLRPKGERAGQQIDHLAQDEAKPLIEHEHVPDEE